MTWFRRKKASTTPTAGKECTCDIFDIGPRCNACVRACLRVNHPLGTHASGHKDFCMCGAPAGQYDAEALGAE